MSRWERYLFLPRTPAELEEMANIRRNTPAAPTQADVERLTEERVPWLKRRRRRHGRTR